MKLTSALAIISFAFTASAAAVDGGHAALSQLFQRDISPRDDPCLTPCYERTGNYCPSPGGCGLQWYVYNVLSVSQRGFLSSEANHDTL